MELGSMRILVGEKKNNNTRDHIVQRAEATPDGAKIQSSKAKEQLKLIIGNNTASTSNRVWMRIFQSLAFLVALLLSVVAKLGDSSGLLDLIK
mmetsp:Transcript_6833/g.6983  ORF Transcript_6833/g.6983 Transcript_6833/m.6983 type:complete len:93 (+) Transcript_6833:714-992(+)